MTQGGNCRVPHFNVAETTRDPTLLFFCDVRACPERAEGVGTLTSHKSTSH